MKHTIAKICCLVGGRLYGNYLTTAYIFVKGLYLLNAIGQLFMLDAFLGHDYHLYGIYVLQRLLTRQDWSASDRFPRVTMCDFKIRHQSRIHQYLVRTSLTENLPITNQTKPPSLRNLNPSKTNSANPAS